jgi:hypothetical protein
MFCIVLLVQVVGISSPGIAVQGNAKEEMGIWFADVYYSGKSII